MLIYVTGGSGSGKSAWAERQVAESGIPQRIYLATMPPTGGDSARRIARHRLQRAGKGFVTVERQTGLETLEVPEGCAVLLEDLTNLFANETFSVTPRGARERVLEGLDRLRERCALTVVVGNELQSDGTDYGGETAAYLADLALLSAAVAERADRVVEVVCGIPIFWKGEGT